MNQSDFLSSPEALRAPLGTVQVNELDHDRDGGDWITRLLSSGFFRHLPPENSQRLFAELERRPVRAGEVVAKQGAQGDYLYIVTHGRCAVTRRAPGSQREIKLTVLQEGDTFGEGALISGTPRTTTVRMLSDGAVMRLGQENFVRLVLAPTLKFLTYHDARRLVADGSVWLDVRPQAERTDHTFDGSISIPSQLLPLKARSLDPTRSYVIYCASGAYSAASCFYLMRMGFDAYVLEGGLEGVCPGAHAGPTPNIVAASACAEQCSVRGPQDANVPDAGPGRTLQLATPRQRLGPREVPSGRNETLEQHCARLAQALECAHEALRHATATAHALDGERSRLEAQLMQANSQLTALLSSDRDTAVDTGRQTASALEAVLKAVQAQTDGICALREELLSNRSW